MFCQVSHMYYVPLISDNDLIGNATTLHNKAYQFGILEKLCHCIHNTEKSVECKKINNLWNLIFCGNSFSLSRLISSLATRNHITFLHTRLYNDCSKKCILCIFSLTEVKCNKSELIGTTVY